jgi:NAD(P)-dependent dehydrogenase (short-subunit alcohol dehydrogenase family)
MSEASGFQGQSVVITGGAGGIGRALAHRFGRDGAKIALLDLDGPALQAAAAELAEQGIEALPVECDVTSLDRCRDAIARVTDARGGVDVLINNAGVTHLSRFSDTDVAVIRRVMEVNFFGAVNCTKAALDSLMERRGRIAVLSSVAGFSPLATRCGYSASKHALHGFFDSMRPELRASGVSVTVVCPFFVDTDMGSRALGGDGGKPHMERTQTGTPSTPEWLAEEIHGAVRRGRRLLVPSRGAKLSYLVSRLAPGTYERMMARRIM